MKKLIAILCTLALTLSCFTVPAFAEDQSFRWEGGVQDDEFECELGDGLLLLKKVAPGDYPNGDIGHVTIERAGVLITDSHNLKGDVVIPDTIDGLPVLGLHSCYGPNVSQRYQRFCLGMNPELETVTLPKTAKYLVYEEVPLFFGGFATPGHGGTDNLKRVYGLSQLKDLAQIEINFTISPLHECPALNPFEDTYGHWAEDAVTWAYHEEIFAGTGMTAFTPDGKVTRGMAASVLHRRAGEPSASGKTFADVPANAYYAKAVKWASENSVAVGYNNGKFGPNDKISREQLAAMLYRYAKLYPDQYDISVSGDLSVFTDANQVSVYAEEALKWAVGSGIVNGKGNGKLDPKGTATRAEMSVMMNKLAEE